MSIEKRAESIMICIANIYNTGGVIQNDDFKFIANQVEEIKKEIADVQLVKHGKWEYEDTIGGMKHYHCTNCDNGSACIADENQVLWWEFCPRCGARMDGDANG